MIQVLLHRIFFLKYFTTMCPGLLLVQVQKVPLNLSSFTTMCPRAVVGTGSSIFGKSIMDPVKLTRKYGLNPSNFKIDTYT